MYFATVLLLMLVLPVGSLFVELFILKSPTSAVFLAGKWFVFWGVGARLLIAGLRQAIQPHFTAKTLLGIESAEAYQVVQELGFANISIGALGILSLLSSAWVMPSAVAGCLFFGLAGFRHVARSGRNAMENTAMVSDLFIFALLLVFVVLEIVSAPAA